MNIFFRGDASSQIGTGHVMRCLALAQELQNRGGDVSFICRELEGNLCERIEQKDIPVYRLPSQELSLVSEWDPTRGDAQQSLLVLKKKKSKIDWLIVDHYALDQKWEQKMRPWVRKIMVIDDLANRMHDCDLLLDQNLYEDGEFRYERLIPSGCQQLLGPTYALLRAEFREKEKKRRDHRGEVRRILISFGGGGGEGMENEVEKAMEAIRLLHRPDICVNVVGGMVHERKEMSQFMLEADLAVGAGGTTTWERCYMGLPSVVIVVAKNQLELTEALANRGAVLNLGWYENVSVEMLRDSIQELLDQPSQLKEMARIGKGFVDGLGTKRVADAIFQ